MDSRLYFYVLLIAGEVCYFSYAEPIPGNNHPYHTPYYKRHGIEKFIEEDDRIKEHCKELLESGADVDSLDDDCKRIYYKEEFGDFSSATNHLNQKQLPFLLGLVVYALL